MKYKVNVPQEIFQVKAIKFAKILQVKLKSVDKYLKINCLWQCSLYFFEIKTENIYLCLFFTYIHIWHKHPKSSKA